MANMWEDFWSTINRPVNFGPIDEQKQQEVAKQGYGFSNRDQMGDLYNRNQAGGVQRIEAAKAQPPRSPMGSNSLQMMKSLNPTRLAGLTRDTDGMGMQRESADGGPVPNEDNDRMAELRALLEREFTPSGENDAMIDQAYAGALANIASARGQANSNFQQSDARVADLTAGHVNEIQTKDRAAVEQNGANLTNAYNETYGNARNQITADRSAEITERGEMLQRLGIQEAGMGEAGQGETEALNNLTQDQAGAQKQAAGYQAADLTRNTEQAQSQASAGVERRSALNSQLQKILGTIDGSEAEVQSQMSMAKLQGQQSERNDFRQEQQFNLDSLAQMEDRERQDADKSWDRAFAEKELAAKGVSAKGSGTVYDVVENDIRSRGLDPQPYLEAYDEVLATAGYNPQAHGDKNAFYAKKMREVLAARKLNADNSVIGRVVLGIHGYGTDKQNAPL